MTPQTNALANPSTLTALVSAWDQSAADIREASRLLKQAENRLRSEFSPDPEKGYHFWILSRGTIEHIGEPEYVINAMKREAWRALVQRMEIRRVMSIARAKELDDKIERGELPEITADEILFMMDAAFSNVHNFVDEMVKEVFEILRPRRSRYKTNTEFDIGKRVILGWHVEQKWSGGGFRPNYHTEKELRALDNVFHHLDGQGMPKEYRGPLYEAIDATGPDGYGETSYFKFRCCKNRSLHIEFKRVDLVRELNKRAGGMRLYQERQAAA